MGVVGQTKIKKDAIVYILGMGLFDLITWQLYLVIGQQSRMSNVCNSRCKSLISTDEVSQTLLTSYPYKMVRTKFTHLLRRMQRRSMKETLQVKNNQFPGVFSLFLFIQSP